MKTLRIWSKNWKLFLKIEQMKVSGLINIMFQFPFHYLKCSDVKQEKSLLLSLLISSQSFTILRVDFVQLAVLVHSVLSCVCNQMEAKEEIISKASLLTCLDWHHLDLDLHWESKLGPLHIAPSVWLPQSMMTEFQEQAPQERGVQVKAGFYDLELEVLQCHFYCILFTRSGWLSTPKFNRMGIRCLLLMEAVSENVQVHTAHTMTNFMNWLNVYSCRLDIPKEITN